MPNPSIPISPSLHTLPAFYLLSDTPRGVSPPWIAQTRCYFKVFMLTVSVIGDSACFSRCRVSITTARIEGSESRHHTTLYTFCPMHSLKGNNSSFTLVSFTHWQILIHNYLIIKAITRLGFACFLYPLEFYTTFKDLGFKVACGQHRMNPSA